MTIWFKEISLEEVKGYRDNSMSSRLGIEFTGITDNSLLGRMPVDERTRQPYGILHGGASCVLAETLGSIAANLTLDPSKKFCVGLDIFTSHLKMIKEGYVMAEATPIKLGNQIQVWEIKAVNDAGDMISLTRLTVAILDKR